MTTTVTTARKAYMASTASVYGALRTYAETLTDNLGDKWWLIPMKGPLTGNEAKVREAIRAEKALVLELAKEKKAKNPKYNEYKPWSDVLRYVKPEVKKGAGANAPRDIHDRFVTELTKLYKAGKADETPTEATLDATFFIGKGLEILGIDLTQFNLVD
jgi:hypothetical protein